MLLFFVVYKTKVINMRNAMWVGGGITGMGEIPMLGVKEKGIAKVIRDIFRNGEKGFFYDPSDMGTMFQEAAGSTAVNATGQPLGLMLDKSKGLKLGGELFIESNVTLSHQATRISAGYYNISSTGDTSAVFTGIAGGTKWRVVEYEITRVGSGSIRIDYASGVSTVLLSTLGRREVYIYGDKANFVRSTTPTDVDFKIYSIKELAGNHAYQTTSASRPILQQTPILGNELAVNGSFDEGSVGWVSSSGGWTFEGGAAVSSGGLTGSRNIFPMPAVTSVGKAYTISMVVRSKGTQGSIGVSFNDGSSFNRWEFKDIENGSVLSRSGTISSNPNIYIKTTDGWDGSIESVSIKEIIGYRTDQNYIEYDGVDDKLLTSLPAPLANATVLRAIPNVGTQVKYNQTLPMLYADSTNHSGLVTIDRVLTRKEQLRLMEELDKRAGATSLDTLTFKAFDNNQEGFVYDPNDLTTMFQDAAGTVPVTEAGQPVGLLLDKSKGLHIGVNLVPQESFAEGITGWILQSGWTLTGGKVVCSGSTSLLLGNTKFVLGKRYRITIVATRTSESGTLSIRNGASSASEIAKAQATGIEVIKRNVLVNDNTSPHIYILSQGWVGEITSISIEEVLGNHAYQTTSASRPILRQNVVTGANYLEFDGVDDYLEVANLALPAPFTAMFAIDRSVLSRAVIFSAATSGYFLSDGDRAGTYDNPTKPLHKVPKDVITYKVTSSPKSQIEIQTGKDGGVLLYVNSFATNGVKYIGRYSPTGSAKFNGSFYGIVVINKLLTSDEESAFRALLNKRMGI